MIGYVLQFYAMIAFDRTSDRWRFTVPQALGNESSRNERAPITEVRLKVARRLVSSFSGIAPSAWHSETLIGRKKVQSKANRPYG